MGEKIILQINENGQEEEFVITKRFLINIAYILREIKVSVRQAEKLVGLEIGVLEDALKNNKKLPFWSMVYLFCLGMKN